MSFSADIDLDFPVSFKPEEVFSWTKASQVKNGYLGQHVCGIYPQRIPVDHVTKVAAIPFKEAEELGYTKIDMLHVSIYDHFKSREEILELLKIEPDWGLLLIPTEQAKLFQLKLHGDILNMVKPKSIEELADVLALIRPGKKQLAKLYRVDQAATRRILYAKDESGYSFKKSHSCAYALVIVLQLHLLSTGIF